MSELWVRTSHREGRTIVSVFGPITRHTTPTLHQHLRRILAGPTAGEIDIDLSSCIHTDVDGLLALDIIGKTARRYGRKLAYVAVPPLIELMVGRYHLDLPLAPDSPNTDYTDGTASTMAATGDEQPTTSQSRHGP
ncbi:STAS domain-containing protein [Actinopolymorpha sp. B17G11]|uniref:STAS domain-containing protein n=1 Tax=unclassified Actinopolymorpha TaxID=2627063 RepID=UPI0032D8FACA